MKKTKIAAAFDKPAADPKNSIVAAVDEPSVGPKNEPEVNNSAENSDIG